VTVVDPPCPTVTLDLINRPALGAVVEKIPGIRVFALDRDYFPAARKIMGFHAVVFPFPEGAEVKLQATFNDSLPTDNNMEFKTTPRTCLGRDCFTTDQTFSDKGCCRTWQVI
jgi:hypothetical protein